MHNTTSGFYPQRFGDRVPTRGDVQSRGRTNLIPSAQGTRRGNSRAENSLGRVQQKQINQAQQMAKGGTHYGNMFDNKKLLTPDTSSEIQSKLATSKNGIDGGIVITNNNKQIPMKIQSKSRVRISTESMN